MDTKRFSELAVSTAKAILAANSMQRRRATEFFTGNDEDNAEDILSIARNYIRLWNFGLFQEGTDPQQVITMLYEAKKKVNAFTRAEETIYKSCGMATRFKIAMAPAYGTAGNLSTSEYGRLEVSETKDFDTAAIRKALTLRESMGGVFDGGDEVTIHYAGEFDASEIIEQISVLLKRHTIPLFNYSFSGVAGDAKLTDFL